MNIAYNRTDYESKLNKLANRFTNLSQEEFKYYYGNLDERVLDIALELDSDISLDYFNIYEEMLDEHLTLEEFHELEDVLYNNSDWPYITEPMNQTKKMKELYRDRLAETRARNRKQFADGYAVWIGLEFDESKQAYTDPSGIISDITIDGLIDHYFNEMMEEIERDEEFDGLNDLLMNSRKLHETEWENTILALMEEYI